MNASVQNLEEAAGIASEFIYSIDNLPHEVSHILQEIKVKEARAQELQQEIDKDQAKYIRHSIRASSVPSSPSSRAPSPKSSALPAKIEASYAEISQLSNEKILLAQTLTELITRTRARLDSDLAKVRILQGEAVDYSSTLGSSLSVSIAGIPGISDVAARGPALQVTESLRSALTATPTLPDMRQATIPAATPLVSASAGPAMKKRRLAASSIKLSSPIKHRSASPTTTAPLTAHHRAASRLSRQSITRHDTDMDEGEGEGEGEDAEGDDERLYCFCQKQSYGDMIACDNEGGCPFEWFHLSCVGMKQPTPEKWYCSVCLNNMTNIKKPPPPPVGRKGRKK
ncbi:Chromatin modification-related protein YNG2 [Hypsizygus marmoreus]|uniref:Chromatin modification-related protein n=1 Tax=Hypsizygus marmoreus TaxID=39966 RepID=A0A369JNK0_HYPMA|nr:Chromatin modification-related protein YNG2 [Hypsizygus marmoreus]